MYETERGTGEDEGLGEGMQPLAQRLHLIA